MISLDKYKGYNYVSALVAAFPLLGQKLSVFAIILWCIYSFFIIIKTQSFKPSKKDIWNIIILSVLYLLYIISYFLDSNKHEVAKLLERSVPFLLFPLLMIVNKQFITAKTIKYCLTVYVASCALLCVYVWLLILSQGIGEVFSEDNYYNPIVRNIFNDTTGIHLPYLGMLFVFASLIILYEMITSLRSNYLLLLVRTFAMIFLLVSVAAFMARTSLLIFFIVTAFFCIKKLKTRKQLLWVGILGIVFITTVLLLPSSQRRIKESLSVKYELPHLGQSSKEVNFRYGVYHCVKEILKDNWLTGVGVGSVQKELDRCYEQYTYKGTDDFHSISYNSHNQYLDIMLKYGVFGLIVFLISLLWGIKTTDMVYQGFIIIIFIALFTENVFSRQVGIMFFTFFNTLFFVGNKKI